MKIMSAYSRQHTDKSTIDKQKTSIIKTHSQPNTDKVSFGVKIIYKDMKYPAANMQDQAQALLELLSVPLKPFKIPNAADTAEYVSYISEPMTLKSAKEIAKRGKDSFVENLKDLSTTFRGDIFGEKAYKQSLLTYGETKTLQYFIMLPI